MTLRHLIRALEVTDIVCVQNAYNLADRSSDPVLKECTLRGIAFVPFCPLGWPKSQHDAIRTNPVVTSIAAGHGATPAQVALAWLLTVAENVLLIPGTSSRGHLAENLAAGSLSLQRRRSRQSQLGIRRTMRRPRLHRRRRRSAVVCATRGGSPTTVSDHQRVRNWMRPTNLPIPAT